MRMLSHSLSVYNALQNHTKPSLELPQDLKPDNKSPGGIIQEKGSCVSNGAVGLFAYTVAT
jgi:hypothetical protein